MRLAYADPPYPGKAHLYADHPDYAGEVDHGALIERLAGYDGWALSTSAASLFDVLAICDAYVWEQPRILAWVKHTVTVGWEPVIVHSARPELTRGLRDWLQCEPDAYQWRDKPDSYVIGQKPEPFNLWVFAWLGAQPGDTLDDLYPGSGNVARAWQRWQQQPTLPIVRGAAAEGRAQRRAEARALEEYPQLDEAIQAALEIEASNAD